jgi:branched-chain amino acid transport system substrate-binding protein
VAVTPKTLPFVEAFKKKYGNFPSYCGYTAYDQVYYIADAVHRAGSADSDKLIEALEKTDYEGTIGRTQFLPKAMLMCMVCEPASAQSLGSCCNGKTPSKSIFGRPSRTNGQMIFPSFIKLSN